MASPQKENGYTPIANEIADALCLAPLKGSEFALIFFVLRKTYGFHKKSDAISISQICEGTQKSRRAVIYLLQELEAKHILLISRKRIGENKSAVNNITFNKNYDTWVVQNSAPQVIKNRNRAKLASAKLRNDGKSGGGSAKLRQKVVQNSVKEVKSFAPTKDTITKDSTKDTAAAEAAGEIVSVIDLFREWNPAAEKWYKNTTQRDATGRLLKRHGKEQLSRVVALLPKTNTLQYFPSITTPVQLEDKWISLKLAFERKKGELEANDWRKNIIV